MGGKEMSCFKKIREKRDAERLRKVEQMQGFTMQAELRATIVSVAVLKGGVEETTFLVTYADGTIEEETVKNEAERFLELMKYIYIG